jgi:flagellar capping protein FliD
METIDLLTGIGGVMLGVIGYFLKRTMEELKEVKEVAYSTSTKVKVLENDYVNKVQQLNDKFDLLAESLRELNKNIQKLNDKIR